MALAGYPDARGAHWLCHRDAGQSRQPEQQPGPKASPPITYDHWCPVCESSRAGR